MKYSSRSARCMTILQVFADLMGGNKMKKENQQDEQMKPWRINTADGEYSESDTSSDEEFLGKSIGHLKVKTIKKSNSVMKFNPYR